MEVESALAEVEVESASADADRERKKRRRSGRPRSGRSRGALSTKARSEQRDAGGSHLGVATSSRRSRSRSRRRRSPRAASRRACARRISSTSSCHRPLSGKFSISSSPAPLKRCQEAQPGDTQAARAARSWRGDSLVARAAAAAATRTLARLLGPLENAKRWLMLADLHEKFAADGWTAALGPPHARRSPPPPPPPRASAGRRPTTSTSAASRGARTSTSPRALPPARRRCSALLRYLASQLLAGACERVDVRLLGTLRAAPLAQAAADASLTTAPPTIPAGATRCRRGAAARRRRRADRAGGAARAAAPPPAARPAARGGCGGRPRPLPLLYASDGDGGDAPPRAGARRYLWWVLVAETLPAARLLASTVAMPTWRCDRAAARRRRRASRLLTDRTR